TLDLAVTNDVSATVSVMIGTGGGALAPRVDYATANSPRSVVITDLNGDGSPDLAMAAQAGFASVLLGTGGGTFAARVDYRVGALVNCLTVADVNRDGSLDLVTANANSQGVSVLLGRGDGTFLATNEEYLGFSSPQWVAAGDFDGDRFSDLAVVDFNSGLRVLMNESGVGCGVT